jgi:glycosyltransferase involved in cell wall biosynthesis
MSVQPSIYFCYNQSIHHIYHSLFIAIELSRLQKKYPVVILSTSREASQIIEKELGRIPNGIFFKKIRHPGYDRPDFSVNGFAFLCRLHLHNPKAVVVTDYYDNIFRKLGVKTFWVYAFHGPENRGYTDPHVKDYDLILVPGEGELRRLEGLVGKLSNYVMAGYSKFDYFFYQKEDLPALFKDRRPILLYNPHFSSEQSSFFDQGPALLKILSESGAYNTIFMPHPDLVRRYPRQVRQAASLANTLLVERPPINLESMRAADVYITDVSSSAFEWLYFNKPAVFFNTKKVDWKKKGLYPVWSSGKVVQTVPEVLGAVRESLANPGEFEQERQRVFHETFGAVREKVSGGIAQMITSSLEKKRFRPQIFFPWDLSQKFGLNRRVLPLAKELNRVSDIRLICRDADIRDFPDLKRILSRIDILPLKRLLAFTPLRWSPKNFMFAEYELFDRLASRHLLDSEPVYALQGMARHIFKKAASWGLKKILIATTLHIEFVEQLHKEEERLLGYDYEWLGERLKNKMLQEYALADEIIVPSQLTFQTFQERGIPEGRLILALRRCDQDFFRRREQKKDDIFRVLFVGRFTPQKGIHYLVKAFSQLALPRSELLLFGSTSTRQTGTWFKGLIQGIPNIRVAFGDPRPAYEQSSVLAHPSLNDNTGAAVEEALAYGLPVIVTENTGTKELVRNGENGFVIPIRDTEALKEKIVYYYEEQAKISCLCASTGGQRC